jgi:hypothetical protein
VEESVMRRFLAGPLSLALVLPSWAVAQESFDGSAVLVGSKVRILAPTVVGGRLEGIVSQMDDQSLVVLQDNHPWRLPRQAITSLDVGTGQKRRALKGMFIGAPIGAALIFLVPTGIPTRRSASDSLHQAGFGLFLGAAYGAGIGALIKSERWSRVPLERVRLSVAPTRGRGVGLSLSVGF